VATNKPRTTVSPLSYKCIRGEREGLVQVLNENSYSMAEYNERTGRFVWMRLLPITQRESVESWVRAQFAPSILGPVKATAPKPKAVKVG
jgi:hypothetical protein